VRGAAPYLSLRAALLTWSSLPSLPVVSPLDVRSVNSCRSAGVQEHMGTGAQGARGTGGTGVRGTGTQNESGHQRVCERSSRIQGPRVNCLALTPTPSARVSTAQIPSGTLGTQAWPATESAHLPSWRQSQSDSEPSPGFWQPLYQAGLQPASLATPLPGWPTTLQAGRQHCRLAYRLQACFQQPRLAYVVPGCLLVGLGVLLHCAPMARDPVLSQNVPQLRPGTHSHTTRSHSTRFGLTAAAQPGLGFRIEKRTSQSGVVPSPLRKQLRGARRM